MSRRPEAPEQTKLQHCLRLLADLQTACRRAARSEQVDIIAQLLATHGPLGDQWYALANLALQICELGLAREAIDRFVEAHGGSAAAQYQKSVLLEQCGDDAAAYDLLCSLPETIPDPMTNAYRRGVAALSLGNVEEARVRLERAIELNPQLGPGYLMLATSADLAVEPELADCILAAGRAMETAPRIYRPAYHYALGKLHADRKEHSAAFAAFERAAREMKSISPFNADADRRNADQSVLGYTAENIAAIASRQSEATAQAIFVTGLPRSGTTLVKQILVSHSKVGDGAEINRLLLLAQEIGGHSCEAVERYVENHGAVRPARLWRHWIEERFPGSDRAVDKSLTSTRLLGLAASLLPDAPLVYLTRDPLDCAWSCFSTFFQGHMPWSHDLEDIALHFRIEDELLRRWQDVLGERLLVVPYELLVSEPNRWIPKILSHCKLAEEPGVYAPHENAAIVRTTSVLQVRRPIHKGAIGTAEPYREYLDPFVSAYFG